MKKVVIIIIVLLVSQICIAQVHTEIKQFFSQTLNQNRIVYVYRPDSTVYPDPLPVVIFLPTSEMPPSTFPFLHLREELENLINSGQIDPMLIVIPDGFGGIYARSMYWNSPGVNGYYGDYIVIETVDFVKNTYHVIQDSGQSHMREAFIIAGFGMGGGGAARLGYKCGDVFSGIASFSGDIDYQKIFNSNLISNYVLPYARQDTSGYIFTPPLSSLTFEWLLWGSASAFSPDSNAQYLCQFPLREGDGSVIDSVKNKWLEVEPVYLAEIHYQTNSQTSMNLFIATDPNDPWFAGLFSQSFVDRISQNYPQVPLTYRLHNSGHSMPSNIVDSMLIWADLHFLNIPTRIQSLESTSIDEFYLNQNYPNPFNPTTTIRYHLSQPNAVTLKIFDILGQEIETLVNTNQLVGEYEVKWDARDYPSGIYFYRLETRSFSQIRKLILLR